MKKSREIEPITGEQLADIFALIVSEFPHMTFDEARAIVDNDVAFAADIKSACNKFCAKRRAEKPRQTPKRVEQYDPSNIPADGVEFELTLDGNVTDPNVMLINSGHTRNLEYLGKVIAGKHTCRFKLVRVGYQRNLKCVQEALRNHGKIPVGQWLQAFKEKYLVHDFEGPISVADPSCRLKLKWTNRTSGPCFPSISNLHRTKVLFFFIDGEKDIGSEHRWLVAVDEGVSNDGNP